MLLPANRRTLGFVCWCISLFHSREADIWLFSEQVSVNMSRVEVCDRVSADNPTKIQNHVQAINVPLLEKAVMALLAR